MMPKLTTVNKLVEAILEEAPGEENKKILANELVIYAKLFWIAEAKGTEEALDYYFGTHSEEEYLEYRTSVVSSDISLCGSCNCMTETSEDGFCLKCKKSKVSL